MILQKCSPCPRRRFGMSNHVFGDGYLRDFDSKLEKFAIDSRRSPNYVHSTHGSDQFACFLRNAGPSCFSMPNLPGPIPTETTAMSVDNCGWFYNHDCGSPPRPEARQPNPQTAICRVQFWFRSLSLKNGDLMSKGENFHLQIGVSSEVHAKRR